MILKLINQVGLTCLAIIFVQPTYASIIPAGSTTIFMRVNAYHNNDSSEQNGNGSIRIQDSVSENDSAIIKNGLGDTTHSLVVEARASAFAGTTSIGASAYALAQSAIGVNGSYGTGATAFSQSQLTQYFEINAPGLTGQSGTMVVPLNVTGNVKLNGDGGEPFGYTEARAYALLWATGLSANNNCRSAAGACNEQSYDDLNGVVQNTSLIPGTLTLAIPFRFGDIGSFSLQLWASANATAVASNNGIANQEADVNFMNTVAWGGISKILDSNGNAVSGWSVQSASGVDLTSPVPVPASFYLFLSGLGSLGWKLCKRKNS